MDDTTILGSVIGQLGQTAKKVGQQIVKLPEEMSKDAGEQIGGSAPVKQDSAQAASAKGSGEPQWESDEERKKFLRDLYGVQENNLSSKQDSTEKKSEAKQTSVNPLNPLVNSDQEKKPSEFQKQIADKSPEEQKKLIELRNQLHKDFYYDPTFNPVKNQEERPAEKVENEKKHEMIELQKKEDKKPTNWAVVREQNKAEQFRGASG